MSEIVSLLTVFRLHLSVATLRQLCQIVFAVLAMTGNVTMRNISRWTSKGRSYRTIQRFYNTLLPWVTLSWMFFRAHLFDSEDVYLCAGREHHRGSLSNSVSTQTIPRPLECRVCEKLTQITTPPLKVDPDNLAKVLSF